MATTNLNVRVDENLKKNAEELLNDLGMNMSTAINVFLRQLVRVHGIPFEIKAEVPNAETLEAMEEIKRMEAHPEQYKGYTDVDEMMRDLLK